MVEAQRITEPNLLSSLTIGLSNLSIDTSKPPQTPPTTLALLQPLASPNLLASCRDPDSRLVRKSNGSVCGTSNNEYLNIQPLSLAWRQAVIKAPPISQLTFDLALPKHKGEKVYWDTALPREGGLAVRTQDVMTLAITIATGTRMRADGVLKFGVTYDETEGVSLRAMKLLEKQLSALGPEYRTTLVKDTEHRDGESGDQDGGE
jgi:hypothetical protein